MTSTPSPDEMSKLDLMTGWNEANKRIRSLVVERNAQALLLSERESKIERLTAEVALGDMRASYDALMAQHREALAKLRPLETQLSEAKAEVERVQGMYEAATALACTENERAEAAEARLQQAVEGLEAYADAAKWSATRVPDGGVGCSSISTGGYTISVSPGAFTMPAAMMDRGKIARTILAAIQGDSHER